MKHAWRSWHCKLFLHNQLFTTSCYWQFVVHATKCENWPRFSSFPSRCLWSPARTPPPISAAVSTCNRARVHCTCEEMICHSFLAGPCVRNSCQSSSYRTHRESAPRCCEHSCWRISASCHRRWCLERNWTVPIIAHDKQEWMCECHRWSVYSHSYDFSVFWCFGIFFPDWKNLADFSQLIIQLVNNHPWIVQTSVTLDADFCLLVIWKEIEIRKYNLHEEIRKYNLHEGGLVASEGIPLYLLL